MKTQTVSVSVWKTKKEMERKIIENIHYISGASIVFLDEDPVNVVVSEYLGETYSVRPYGNGKDGVVLRVNQ